MRALWVPDKKRILIDASKPKLKHRWSEGHEVGHSLIPWHEHLLHGDNDFSLSAKCQAQIEAEANYASGQLLFMQNRFVSDARDTTISMEAIKSLAKRYGNTITSTLWRYVEQTADAAPMVAVVCQNPHKLDSDFDPLNPCKYFIQSPEFHEKFSGVEEQQLATRLDRVGRELVPCRAVGHVEGDRS